MHILKNHKALSVTILTVISFLTVFLGYRSSLLQFNYNFTDFFPKNDTEVDRYNEFRKTYGSENDFLILVIEHDQIFNPKFLSKLDSFTREIEELDGTIRVISPTRLKQPIIGDFSFFEIPLLHIDNKDALKKDSINIYGSYEWPGAFFGKNRKSVLVLIEHKQGINGEPANLLLSRVHTIIENHGFVKTYMSGRILAENVFIKKMKEELSLFISLSILLLITFLWIAYRSLWGILVPLSAVLISIIWTCGIMQLTGYKLNVLTVLLPSILFIITISDITHFLSKYIEELRAGQSKMDAFSMAYKEVGVATFVTALTTAVGFITFLNAEMQPIKYFGLYAAVGVFVSYIVAFTYMPAIILLLPKPRISQTSNNEHFWHKRLHKTLLWVFMNHKRVIYGSIIICLIGFVGMFYMEINSTIIDDISEKDHLKKSLKYAEENFGGVRSFEMNLQMADTNGKVFQQEVFRKITKLEAYLSAVYGVNNMMGPSSMIKGLNKAQNGAQNNYYFISDDSVVLTKQLKTLKKESKNKLLRNYIKNGGNRIRISGRVKDFGSKYFGEKNKKLYEFLDSLNKTGPRLNCYVTGSATLVDKNNMQLANDMILDLFIGILTIGVIVGFIFRSFKMAVLAIIPNFAPLILIAGIMGAFGMNLKASNSVIFSIAFGIAIDDSIHFLSRLKEELHKGKPLFYAIKTTYLSTGKAMLITSLIVIAGFCTMIFSDFGGTFYMGLLVSLTLVFAIAFDFILMPALLINFYYKKKK